MWSKLEGDELYSSRSIHAQTNSGVIMQKVVDNCFVAFLFHVSENEKDHEDTVARIGEGGTLRLPPLLQDEKGDEWSPL